MCGGGGGGTRIGGQGWVGRRGAQAEGHHPSIAEAECAPGTSLHVPPLAAGAAHQELGPVGAVELNGGAGHDARGLRKEGGWVGGARQRKLATRAFLLPCKHGPVCPRPGQGASHSRGGGGGGGQGPKPGKGAGALRRTARERAASALPSTATGLQHLPPILLLTLETGRTETADLETADFMTAAILQSTREVAVASGVVGGVGEGVQRLGAGAPSL